MALIDAGGDNGHVINIQIGKDRCIVGKNGFCSPMRNGWWFVCSPTQSTLPPRLMMALSTPDSGQIVFHAVGTALGDGAEVNRRVRGEEG